VLLGKLVGVLYLSCIIFIVVVFGSVACLGGFSLWRFVRYIWDEVILVYAIASSEVALPRLIGKLEKAGCAASVVGFVIPTGYSFNLDGTSLYMTLGALFIAQATGVHLSLSQQMELLAVLLVTSKGIATVPGGGLIVLAGALTTIPQIPVAGLALVLGVDRFMDSMRTATNLIGNGVAAMAIARWENQRNEQCMHQALNGEATLVKAEHVDRELVAEPSVS
jgi:aerobic C4-dicarboxylate transport protein